MFVDPFAVCICRRVAVSNGVVGSQKTERLYLCGWHSWAPRQLKLLTNNANTNTYTNQDICTNMYYKIICTRKIHLHFSRPELRSIMKTMKPGWHKQTRINVLHIQIFIQIHCIKYKMHVLLAFMGCIRRVLGFVARLN